MKKLLDLAIIDTARYLDILVKSRMEEIRSPLADILFQTLTQLGSPTLLYCWGTGGSNTMG